jgi:membrane-bound metal-dependent hydrolase YbcI (DUF457 family)
MALVTWALTEEPSFSVVFFLAAVLGSVLPDMDSDSSIPFHVTFGSLALVAAALVFSFLYRENPEDWRGLFGWTLGAAFFVWAIIGFLFKRFTRHRGMAHSLPAGLLSGLVIFFLAVRFGFSDPEAFFLMLALMGGFLSHLVMDEIYAAVNFQGRLFSPNKALGTALKLKSNSTAINLVVYGAIFFLLAGHTSRFLGLVDSFWKEIQ